MNLYTLALFVHMSGAIGIFGSLGAMVFGAVVLRGAQRTEDVRLLTRLINIAGNVAAVCIVILGIAGFYMAATVWGVGATWIIVATISFILLAPFGLLVIDPRVRSIAKQARAAPDGPLPEALARRAQVQGQMLEMFLSVYIAWLLGIVFLMTNKPASGDAVLVMLIAGIVGLLASQLWRLRAKNRTPRQLQLTAPQHP
jgi:uncharacterized membrane protein